MLCYIEACVDEINRDFPSSHILIAGDLNQQPDQELVEQTGLTQIVHQPTRGENILDRIYVSDPSMFNTVRVVASVVRSDHKDIVAFVKMGNKAHSPKPHSTSQPFSALSGGRLRGSMHCSCSTSPTWPLSTPSRQPAQIHR